MNNDIKTKDYVFFIARDKVMVKYLKHNIVVQLNDINIEMIGITQKDNIFTVALVTQSGISKLKHGISETLEVIGFAFDTMHEALAVLNFIVMNLEEEKDAGDARDARDAGAEPDQDK